MALKKKIKLHFKLPKMDNELNEISPKVFDELNKEFVKTFGGLTVNSPADGFWEHKGLTYRDQTIEYVVFIPEAKFKNKVEKDLDKYLKKFKKTFKQIEIFCYYYSTCATWVFLIWNAFVNLARPLLAPSRVCVRHTITSFNRSDFPHVY